MRRGLVAGEIDELLDIMLKTCTLSLVPCRMTELDVLYKGSPTRKIKMILH